MNFTSWKHFDSWQLTDPRVSIQKPPRNCLLPINKSIHYLWPSTKAKHMRATYEHVRVSNWPVSEQQWVCSSRIHKCHFPQWWSVYKTQALTWSGENPSDTQQNRCLASFWRLNLTFVSYRSISIPLVLQTRPRSTPELSKWLTRVLTDSPSPPYLITSHLLVPRTAAWWQ